MSKGIGVSELVTLIKSEIRNEGACYYKAKWDFAWDSNEAINAKVVTVNIGNGFEDALAVKDDTGGTFIYAGNIAIENFPDKETLLMFECDTAIYIKDRLF